MLVWTKKLPEVPGYYWYIRKNGDGHGIVLCFENENKMCVFPTCREDKAIPVKDFKAGAWAGPIPFPQQSLLEPIDVVLEEV